MSRPAERYISIDGKPISVTEAARQFGVPIHTAQARYEKGWRGRSVVRRVPGPGNYKTWDVGLPVSEWQPILDYARERGSEAAYRKFGVPAGAIRAVMRGEWERVA